MRKSICNTAAIILFCLMNISNFAQAPNWIWAKSAGGNREDNGKFIGVDASGNSYVAGIFTSDTISFGTVKLKNSSADPQWSDIFIVKYDGSGNLVWTKHAVGSGADYLGSMVVDANGNTYLTGSFFGSNNISFGNINITTDSLGHHPVFIVKYNSAGEVQWATCSSGANADGVSIAVDPNGNSYLTGHFYNATIKFNNIILAGTVTGEIDKGGNFLVKFDPLGNAIWANCFGISRYDECSGICVDKMGNSYITGDFYKESITFGSVLLNSLSQSGGFFVAKYNTSGNAIWAKTSAQASWYAFANSIASDPDGNVLVTGYYELPIAFDTIVLPNANPAFTKPFFVKYDSLGQVKWAKIAGIEAIASDRIISFDSEGNSFLLNLNGITKLDKTGTVVWDKYLTTYFGSIAADAPGNVYIAGIFTTPTCLFDAITLTNSETGFTYGDFFAAKLNYLLSDNNSLTCPSKAVTLYPIPAENMITVETHGNFQDGNITILNFQGQALLTRSLKAGKVEIDISGLARGIYFARFKNGEKMETIKIVK